ncbi:MFS general substrate transporter [Diplogelasinospora grovesii]|uniref:MFS general substrate transporter n=1 Tax=Diplogelasinospora grovesii TaxID=303347 RepID=A0AAN6NA15_9PEZI|nr:MFS general substrate transporter [Diplogelasinospora grovesii]
MTSETPRNTDAILSSNPGVQTLGLRQQEKNGEPSEQSSATIAIEPATETDNPEAPYSVFTRKQKKWIVFIAASAGWFSTASSLIYFPAIPFLARDLQVGIEKINLTVTSYLVASGIFPTLVGSAADWYGRRPVFIAALAVYVAVNVGLAVQRDFAALVTLRMLQSAAVSGTFSFAYGVLGDLTTPVDRGGYVGFISIFLNTPPSVAPLISGLLLMKWDWPSIFWFLSISSSVVFLAVLLFLPETCRQVVGNGSLRAPPINTPLIPILGSRPHSIEASYSTAHYKLAGVPKGIANPLSALRLLKNGSSALAFLCYSIYYAIYSCLQASLSTIFVETYDVSGLVAGLSYLPFGVACVTASSLAGRLLDYDYQRTARSLGMAIDRRRVDGLATFPIEHARLRTCKYFIVLCAPLIVGYGWALQVKAHIAVPLVLQFLIGFTNQVNFTSLNALLVDLHPDCPSTVQAANNLFRCGLAAGGLALLDLMLSNLGAGWCFVVFAALHIATLPVFWIMERHGLAWRRKRSLET